MTAAQLNSSLCPSLLLHSLLSEGTPHTSCLLISTSESASRKPDLRYLPCP